MRNTTKTFVASVGMGICAISYAIGANSAAGTSFSTVALNNTTGNTTGNTGSSAQPSTSASASNSGSGSGSGSGSNSSSSSSASASASSTTKAAGHTKKPTKKPTSSGSGSSSSPAPSSSSSSSASATPKPSTSTPPSSTKVTKTGSTIQGNDPFGDYAQIQITKTNGKVIDVQVVNSYSNGGREAVFPYLAQEAVAGNGRAVANYSGATYTTMVFNKALASAMSKF